MASTSPSEHRPPLPRKVRLYLPPQRTACSRNGSSARLDTLPGVGRVRAGRLAALGLETIEDLLFYTPFRHEAPARLATVATLREGEEATLRVVVQSFAVRAARRRGLSVLEALIGDESASIPAVWYNQAYLADAFSEKPELLVRGVLRRNRGSYSFQVTSHEILREDGREEGIHTVGLIPVYPATGDVSVRSLRTLLGAARVEAEHVVDPLPSRLVARASVPVTPGRTTLGPFPSFPRRGREEPGTPRLRGVAVPAGGAPAPPSRGRSAASGTAPAATGGDHIRLHGAAFVLSYGCSTPRHDGDRRRPRAPDPDAAAAPGGRGFGQDRRGCLRTSARGGDRRPGCRHGAHRGLGRPACVGGLGEQMRSLGVPTLLLKGSQPAAERREALRRIAEKEPLIVVGTQALIQEGVDLSSVRVVVIDEQHRFGVRQRAALMTPRPGQPWPDTLHMTATPIPRTLSLTHTPDLGVSVIDWKPPQGRTPRKPASWSQGGANSSGSSCAPRRGRVGRRTWSALWSRRAIRCRRPQPSPPTRSWLQAPCGVFAWL